MQTEVPSYRKDGLAVDAACTWAACTLPIVPQVGQRSAMEPATALQDRSGYSDYWLRSNSWIVDSNAVVTV